MTCSKCHSDYPPHRLEDGKCLTCLCHENRTLKAIIVQLVQQHGDPNWRLPANLPQDPDQVVKWVQLARPHREVIGNQTAKEMLE
jgi:hypothetical protein